MVLVTQSDIRLGQVSSGQVRSGPMSGQSCDMPGLAPHFMVSGISVVSTTRFFAFMFQPSGVGQTKVGRDRHMHDGQTHILFKLLLISLFESSLPFKNRNPIGSD